MHPNEARWIKECDNPERAVCQSRESHLSAMLQWHFQGPHLYHPYLLSSSLPLSFYFAFYFILVFSPIHYATEHNPSLLDSLYHSQIT